MINLRSKAQTYTCNFSTQLKGWSGFSTQLVNVQAVEENQKHTELSPSAAAAAAKSLQLCPTLCDPINGSPLGSSVPGILQARILRVGCHCLLQCMKVKSEVAQSCPTLSDPMDCSPPGSSVHEIFQARVLEWGAIAFSKRSIHCLYSQMA